MLLVVCLSLITFCPPPSPQPHLNSAATNQASAPEQRRRRAALSLQSTVNDKRPNRISAQPPMKH